eukprot:COSAG02_NODE_5649_length_4152_cov_2.423143_2_plen_613_part_00
MVDGGGGGASLLDMLGRVLASLLAAVGTQQALAHQQHEQHAGIWSWACGYAAYQGAHPAGFRVNECFEQVLHAPPPWLRGWFHVLYWNKLEPEKGIFNWEEFDKNLTLAAEHGLQLNPVLYIFDGANPMPSWMANVSTPVLFHRGGRSGRLEPAPNYLDSAFQGAWQKVINEFARHVTELPPKVKQSIWAVQAVAGITGDNRPWNGVVKCEDASVPGCTTNQTMGAAAWMNYSRAVADMYIDAFLPTGIPVIANLHDGFSGQEDNGWFLQRAADKGMHGAAVKEGKISHWYQGNGDRALFEAESPLMLRPQPDGSYARSRGELAVEPDPDLSTGTYGNWAHSPWWSLQALTENALTFGLDTLNLYAGWLGNSSFAPTMTFFNRHAGQKNPATAQAAFLSFRDSLDTADTLRFPIAQFGPVDDPENPSQFANANRMVNIAAAFDARGARLGQKGAASAKNSVHQKKANALIDVCWQCYDGNFQQHLRQLDPLNTSIGWWQLGPVNESFGRFARGLEHASGKTEITLELDPAFAAAAAGRVALVRVVYYDQGVGQWALAYGGKQALVVRKQDTRGGRAWRTAEVNVTIVQPNQMLTLSSLGGEDDVFSLIEVLL